MALSVPRKIVLGTVAASIVLALCAFGAYRSLRRAIDSARWVLHSQEVLTTTRELREDVTSAEIGRRGFLLGGSADLAEPYRAALRRANADLDRLSVLVDDNPQQAARTRTLRRVIAAELLPTDTMPAGGEPRERKPAAARAAESRRQLASIHARIAQLAGIERVISDGRRDAARANVRIVFVVIDTGFAIALLVVAGATITLTRDVRERERVGVELAEALARSKASERAKSDFLARMSHELRTPLNSIIGFTNILLRNPERRLPTQDITYLQRVQVNGQHLLGIINDILDLSKVESGRMDVTMGPVDLAALVAQTVGQFPGRDGLAIDVILPDGLAAIESDGDKLRQVLLNLVSNAIKFTERGRVVVRVVSSASGEPTRLDVVDTGIGISPDRLQAIFDAFEQAEVTTARRYGGTGLGLSISRSICERLGYRLTAVSEPGAGATFSILFDATEPAPRGHEPVAPLRPLADGVRAAS